MKDRRQEDENKRRHCAKRQSERDERGGRSGGVCGNKRNYWDEQGMNEVRS